MIITIHTYYIIQVCLLLSAENNIYDAHLKKEKLWVKTLSE